MKIPNELKPHIQKLRAAYPRLTRDEFRKVLKRMIKDRTWERYETRL